MPDTENPGTTEPDEPTNPSVPINPSDPSGGPEVDGPVVIPIFPQAYFVQPVTEFSSLPATLSLPPAAATQPITVAYYNSSSMTPANVTNMPTPTWDSNGKANFDVVVDQELIDALGSETVTLLVQTVSGQHQATLSIDIDIS